MLAFTAMFLALKGSSIYIRGRLVYDLKHHGYHKGRYVARGHLADILVDSIY